MSRALGASLACAPYVGSAALRFAAEPLADRLPEGYASCPRRRPVSVALLEPGRGWSVTGIETTPAAGGLARPQGGGGARRSGRSARRRRDPRRHGPGLVLLQADAPGVAVTSQPAFDSTVPMSAVELADVDVPAPGRRGSGGRRAAAAADARGGLLAAAEAVGAAGRLLEDARTLRGRAAAVRPDDRQLPGAAPHPGGHVRAPGEHVVDRPLRGRRPRRRPRRGGPRRPRWRRRTSRARRARSRTARCRSSVASPSRRSTPRTGSCAASSCASSSSATAPITSASSGGRSRRTRPAANSARPDSAAPVSVH